MPLSLSEPPFELQLLGRFDVRYRGHSVAGMSYNKMRALLAYLAMTPGQDHSREALAGLLWASNDLATARGNLRRTLADLRRVLEIPTGMVIFAVTKNSIRFVAEPVADVWTFMGRQPVDCASGAADIAGEESAIALYRGEFLAGLSLPDSPDFEDWLQIQREAMHRRALALLERTANYYEQRRDYRKALPFALRHSELEPWSEEAHRRVMRLYALNEQGSAAIDQYQACCRLLKKELGALPDEETRQLADSIRQGEFRPSAAGSLVVPALPGMAPATAERRQVTVLYCELSLAAIDDPDEAVSLLRTPQARCVGLIRQFAGHVVQAHGGGLLAYFGYPQANEYAARRAVQVALAMVQERSEGLDIRVGIHTGLIVADDFSAMPDSSGRSTRLAIALRQQAADGEVMISQATHDIVAGYFACANLGTPAISGFPGVRVFKALQESGARTRLDAVRPLTPLAGRQQELALLLDAWAEAAQSRGQVVFLQGDAGIGKSRLVLTLIEHLASQPHAVRELRCFPEFSHSPYHPVIAMLEALFAFGADDTPADRFAKLVAYLQRHVPTLVDTAVPLLGLLLSLPIDAGYPLLQTSPKRQKEQINAVLLDILQALARQQPVLLIVEDLHWSDPSLLALLPLIVKQLADSAVLIVLTARPEFTVPWIDDVDRVLHLAPLAGADLAAMLNALPRHIPGEYRQHIIARADGVPLFIEEVSKIVGQTDLDGVPNTLQDLLAARFDLLGAAKSTAQLAATLGREFDLEHLKRISPSDPAILAAHLQAIQEAGLILPTQQATLQFKHALIQAAAYQSQTKADRQAAHRRIADVLRRDYPDIVTANPELLAQHLADGGDTLAAIDYWVKAGQRAALHSANVEAVSHFQAALQLVATLPAGLPRDRLEFTLQVGLCPVLYAAKGYGAIEAAAANARIVELSGRVDDSPELFQAKWVLAISSIASVGSRGMPDAARQLLKMAGDDPLLHLSAHFLATNASFWLGEFAASCSHGEQVIRLADATQQSALLAHFGTDLVVFSGAYYLSALTFLGYPEQANRHCQDMLQRARASGHPHTLAQALSWAAVFYRWTRQPELAATAAAEAIELSCQHDFLLWLACGEMTYGWALMRQGQVDYGITQARASIAGMRLALGGIAVVFLTSLAEGYIHLGRHADALLLLEESLAAADSTGDGHYLAEVYRLKGCCLLALAPGQSGPAEAAWLQALSISRQQQARLFELRASVDLARLWQAQGRAAAAQPLLRDIYEWFSEGLTLPDLQEAAALLANLQRESTD